MRRNSGILLISIFALSLLSCASGTPYLELSPSLTPENEGTGRIFFYRVTGFAGSAIQPEIVVNDETVGRSIPQGFFYLDKPPGDYVVVTTTEVKRKCSFVLEEGQTRYIRFGISMGFFAGHVFGELVDPAEAREEIKKCKYTAPAEMMKSIEKSKELSKTL